MPATVADIFNYVTLTGVVNEMKPPSTFVRDLIFGDHEALPTENFEIGVLIGGREVAPFVQKGASAVMVGGFSEKRVLVSPPNIRLKRPTEANELMFTRPVGSGIYVDQAQIMANIRRRLGIDLARLNDMIANAEEYMSCMIGLRGALSWESGTGDVFKVTLPRPSGNNITVDTYWDDTSPLPAIWEDFNTAKKVMADEVGLSPTDVILGEDAATAFRTYVYTNELAFNKLNISEGTFNSAAEYTREGVQFLGVYCGVRVWEYSRHFTIAGVDTPLVRTNYAEFISRSPSAEDKLYYGAIPDLAALESGGWVGERFSKSWTQEDPSVRQLLVHSRPLPFCRRPGSKLSMKVLADA